MKVISKKLKVEYENEENKYFNLSEKSRKVVRLSKKVIYAIQRNDIKEAKKYLEEMEADFKEMLDGLGDKHLFSGSVKIAVQEYVEAAGLMCFVEKNELIGYNEKYVDIENYLCGICDLSGELVRLCVNCGINGDLKVVERIKSFVEKIYYDFLEFDLRNSELRKKSDQIKWNLEKIQDYVFDLKKR